MKVGMIGLGVMGMPMLQRLCGSGHQVSVFARRREVGEAAGQLGASAVDSAAALAAEADLLIVCLYSDEQVRELLLGEAALVDQLRPGSVLVLHTTGSPQTATDIAARAAARQVQVLDAPVSGGPHNIAAGELTLLVGGEAAALDRCREVLGAYASPILHVGPLGAGQKTKLVNNLLFAAQVKLAADASRLLQELGADVNASLAAITHCSGDSAVLRMAQRSGSVARLQQSAGAFIDKDRTTALALVETLGLDPGCLR
ncbi:NAD(P)-dependent oxidoreductase [Pseudomaricurvus sp. HS19]|uniref:NAD(P)-dependent oxidoreductase n=1 Tax=Pseudomaricurvus sp. HS19 TaxID=2692626 RepID=UPI0013ABBE67|nr:NAD(P)-dependent oxidoreductase [Pseudomaricurvus sp. HS19]MYM64409.1 NAD-binding protein [Pseudomaricurvus sp. HS19]